MSAEPVFLGIDFGTSVFKAGLYRSDGSLCGLGKSELKLDVCDYSAWRFELRADSFWLHVRTCIEEALLESGTSQRDIAGISYASQANSFLLLDRNDKELSSIIMWTDQRGAPYLGAFKHRWERDQLLRILGTDEFTPEMAISKLRWFQEEAPETWSQMDKIQTIPDYFIYSLTGKQVGDMGTASLLGLWNQASKRWWPEALDYFGIEEGSLSVPLTPGTIAGHTTGALQEKLDLPAGIPVYVGSLDHHVGGIVPLMSFGAEISLSLGTVVAATTINNCFQPCHGIITGPDFQRECYYQLSFSNFGAAWIKRLKDEKCPEQTWDEFLNGAIFSCRNEELGDLKVDVERSLQKNQLTFNGMELHHSTGHLTAAVLIAVVNQITELVDQTCPRTNPKLVCLCGGGAQNSIWEDLLSDALGTEVISLPGMEFGCLGAALLAVAGCRIKNISVVAKSTQVDDPEN
jgi:sugar (pentulose or hexulose) kinase